MQTLWHRTRRRALAAADALLRHAVPDQLRDRRRHRPRAGVPVRDELVGLLEVRRQRLRRAARDRGPRGVHARGDVPRPLDLRLGPALAARAPGDAVDRRGRHRGCRRTSSSSRTRGCSTRSATRSSTARRSSPSVWALLSNGFALRAYVHTMLAGLIFGSIVVLGVCCWHFLRGRDVDLFRKAAKLALIVAVPVTLLQLGRRQPLRRGRDERAEHEDRRLRGAVGHRASRAAFSLFQIGGFTEERPDADLLDPDPATPLVHGHRLVRRAGAGPQPSSRQQEQRQYGRGNYMPNVRVDLLVDAGDGLHRGC